MGPLTEWVLARAAADCAAWTAADRDWTVAVNVSARNLNEQDFAGTVAGLARQAGLRPAQLQIEVTETALPVDPDAAAATLAALAAYGFGTALDDFGVGYASLSHLRSLQLTEVKIDRAFVAGVAEAGEDREVVAALIQLAHGLGLTVCAEGVDTAEAADWLREVGCDRAQGYFFSRPLPWTDLPPDDRSVPGRSARNPFTKVMS
jgi:diguanylate cyclase